MLKNNDHSANKSTAAKQADANLIISILRILTILEKTLDRVGRLNFHDQSQYPPIMLEIKGTIISLRVWVKQHKNYCGVSEFHEITGLCIVEIQGRIVKLMQECKPVKGKKGVSHSRKLNQYQKFVKTIGEMLVHLTDQVSKFEVITTDMGVEIEKFLIRRFEEHCSKSHEIEAEQGVSKRGKKTYVFSWSDKKGYHLLINDKKNFVRRRFPGWMNMLMLPVTIRPVQNPGGIS